MQATRSTRGFASMDQAKQREIARKGGRSAHLNKTAHEFTSEEARAAGRKGGERVSANREHMARIGQLGGRSSASRRRNNIMMKNEKPAPDKESKSKEDKSLETEHQGELQRSVGVESAPEAGEPSERKPEKSHS